MIHTATCHCGAVAAEVEAPADLEVVECNCSMCERVGYLHLIVPRSRFRIVRGADMITTYTFNTGVAQHMFCKICGVKPFYVPRSNPDGFSVNARCLDRSTVRSMQVSPFDGRNWEQSAGAVAHLTKE